MSGYAFSIQIRIQMNADLNPKHWFPKFLFRNPGPEFQIRTGIDMERRIWIRFGIKKMQILNTASHIHFYFRKLRSVPDL